MQYRPTAVNVHYHTSQFCCTLGHYNSPRLISRPGNCLLGLLLITIYDL